MTATSYALGIDLGTTYTAAAVCRQATVDIFALGSRGPTIPSLVFLRDDQVILTGEAAERRGIVEPVRLAREFKRRVGDSAPIMLGQTPYSAERLMAALLKDVVGVVATREGADPDHVAVTHPANWGPFKIDLLRHAMDLARLRSVTLLSEPVAAAVHHSSKERVEPDSVVAVYDLGGGTFDAAVLRKTATAFETLGEPEGIERLGGIDFDEAVFAYVRNQLGGQLEALDGGDPTGRVAIGMLRRECVGAKEALSADSETTIPVALPNVHTSVRLTRAEFEPMIQPAIAETIEALRRAVEGAGLHPEDLESVLLVGGSSQIPLVSQTVSSALGRPVAVDSHPKHSVALGAAVVAARASGAGSVPARASAVPAAAATPALAGAAAATSRAMAPRTSISPASLPPSDDPPAGGGGVRGGPGRAVEAPALPGQARRSLLPASSGHVDGGGDRDDGSDAPARYRRQGTASSGARRSGGLARRLGLAAAVLVVAGVAAGVYSLGSDPGGADQATSGDTPADDGAADEGAAEGAEAAAPATTVDPATVPCATDAGRCARISGIRLDGDRYLVDYTVESFDPLTPEHGGTPDDHHVHFFLDTTPPEHAGTNSDDPGQWTVWDRVDGDGALLFDAAAVADAQAAGAGQLCVLVADASHGVEQNTGNCMALPT